jgi:hypothetical protein
LDKISLLLGSSARGNEVHCNGFIEQLLQLGSTLVRADLIFGEKRRFKVIEPARPL